MIWLLMLLASGAAAQNSSDSMRAAIEKQRAAIAVQREAVRKQVEQLKLPPLITPADAPTCDPLAEADAKKMTEAAAKANDLAADLLRAVIQQESNFYPCAVSSKGAQGLMQLMPATVEEYAVKDPFDAAASLDGGARYLKKLIGKYNGDLGLALAAYNAGPGAVDEAHGIPDIPETRNYVDTILRSLGKMQPGAAQAPLAPEPPAAPH